MSIERIASLFEKCGGKDRKFPPTDLYNEGWMHRLALDWLSSNPGIPHDLAFSTKDRWYSEALLPSAFLPRFRGDNLGETWTHADGVIGDFTIGENREGDLTLRKDANRFIVIEAKMFSKLSSGVRNARYFNQAARNVACIAEVLCRAQIAPHSVQKIGFFVIAPEVQIHAGVFTQHLTHESLHATILRRVSEYKDSSQTTWFEEWLLPTLDKIEIREISWEEICTFITQYDSEFGEQLNSFYRKCLKFNQYAGKNSVK